jgi:hypothetical protein
MASQFGNYQLIVPGSLCGELAGHHFRYFMIMISGFATRG